MKKVSVIMPNYNHAPFLKERLNSIFAQNYPEMEIILMDDASTDNSLSVLETYEQFPQVKVLQVNSVNSGNTFMQWKRGLAQATGEYVWIAESDDVAHPSLLSHLVQTLEQTNSVLAFAHSECIDENGQILPRRIDPLFQHNFTMEGLAFITRFLLGENMICNASAVVFRRSACAQINMKTVQSFTASGDRLFWIQVAKQGRVAYVSEPLNHFRQHTCKVSYGAAAEGLNIVQDHKIYRFIAPSLHLTCRDQRMICGYHWDASRRPWVNNSGQENAKQAWASEPYFTFGSWLLYRICRFAKRFKVCSI